MICQVCGNQPPTDVMCDSRIYRPRGKIQRKKNDISTDKKKNSLSLSRTEGYKKRHDAACSRLFIHSQPEQKWQLLHRSAQQLCEVCRMSFLKNTAVWVFFRVPVCALLYTCIHFRESPSTWTSYTCQFMCVCGWVGGWMETCLDVWGQSI